MKGTSHSDAKMYIEPMLDRITLQNDQILLWQQRRKFILKKMPDKSDDLGIGEYIEKCEGVQQKYANTISEIDRRGVVLARMLRDYMHLLSKGYISEDVKRLIKNRIIIMGLLPVYRLKPQRQTKIITEMLGRLPTSGRDYSDFEWR